MSPAIQLQV